ncbi:MAG: ParB/RepB/Spo0J family partition protein [Oscillospiraceae bacterium]
MTTTFTTTLTLSDICDVDSINNVDMEKVAQIAESIRENGWQGAPILVHTGINQLVTGSHRLAALKLLAEDDSSVYDMDVAVDVSEIVDEALEREGYSYGDIDYSEIGWLFENSEIEAFKDEICEW